jgi:simple sugar transport system ATP-binding protein
VSDTALSLQSIVKRFGTVLALDGASFTAARGTVHALLGENGAGKTTLMRIAYGLERPDSGRVVIDGSPVELQTTRDAIARGVGMVQQHFSLVPAMTVAENVSLGGRGRLHPAQAAARVRALAALTSFDVEPDARIRELSVAAQQRVEVLKALAHGARTLILDEPTAVLAPSEAQELMRLLRGMAAAGTTVVLITHKLREALSVADTVTVLRRGKTVVTMPASEASEGNLARAMFPEGVVPHASLPGRAPGQQVVAELRGVDVRDARGLTRLRAASIVVHAHEIVGVAGVEGSGHHELLLALAGRIAPAAGVANLPQAIGFIPEHRQRDALIPDFSVVENIALRDLVRVRGRMPWAALAEQARALVERNGVRVSSVREPVRALSGGNQQKLVLARELEPAPALVVAENPTQGLDLRAAGAVRRRLIDARDAGAGVVLYTSDLDELLAIADRVVVAFQGTLRDVPRNADAIGRAMLGA